MSSSLFFSFSDNTEIHLYKENESHTAGACNVYNNYAYIIRAKIEQSITGNQKVRLYIPVLQRYLVTN